MLDPSTVERAIKDSGIQGRLVSVDGKLIRLDLFDQETEGFTRHELGLNEFCDLVLDWRERRPAA